MGDSTSMQGSSGKPEVARRLDGFIRQAGIPEYELAEKTGVNQPTIHRIRKGKSQDPKSASLRPLAAFFGISEDQLRGNEPLPKEGAGRTRDDPGRHEKRGRRVPVINHVQAGEPAQVIDDYAPGDGFEYIWLDPEAAEDCGSYTFALKIEGESMLPEFHPGDIVVIDPDVPPLPGDYVVAKLEAEGRATFKKYRPRGPQGGNDIFEMAPLNDDWPTIRVDADNPGHVIGTMVEHRRKRRRRA